jgi:hypothetical protein
MKTKALTLKGARARFGEQIDRAKAENKTEVLLPAPILMPTLVNLVEQVLQSLRQVEERKNLYAKNHATPLV